MKLVRFFVFEVGVVSCGELLRGTAVVARFGIGRTPLVIEFGPPSMDPRFVLSPVALIDCGIADARASNSIS